MKCLCIVTKSVLVSNCKFLSGFLPCFDHLAGIFCIVSHWFLAHNMFSSLKCCNSDWAVSHVWCTYMYNINLNACICKHFLIICINFCTFNTILFCCFFCTLRNNIAESYHFRFVCLCFDRWHVFLVSDSTTSYDCNS